ncbi:hypothetical protein LCGC14_2078180 [marine sediment metagenome]|uniref:Uncharacterized protein n=1 Tax=marine sediment metagenome TaxID=412755 RepID=A0A0F9EG78_9ZZZZ
MGDANSNPPPHYHHTQNVVHIPLSDPGKIQDPNVRRLLSRRPGYLEDTSWWNLCRTSYIGGKPWFDDGNLPAHVLEMRTNSSMHKGVRQDNLIPVPGGNVKSAGAPMFETRNEYDMRVSQGFRLNLTREIVEPLSGLLEQHPSHVNLPSVSGLEDFNKQADIARTESLESMLNTASEWAGVLGIYYVWVDNTLTAEQLDESLSAAGVEPNKQGQIPASLAPESQPYARLVDPGNVLDGFHDEAGKLVEVLMAEYRHNGKQLGHGSATELFYRYVTREFWQVWQLQRTAKGKMKAVLIEEGVNHIGQIPLIPIMAWDTPGEPWRGRAIVEDAVLTDRALAGLASSLLFSLENDSDSQTLAIGDLTGFDGPDDPKLHMAMAQVTETLRSRIGMLHKGLSVEVLNKNSGQKDQMLETYKDIMTLQLRMVGLADKVDDPSAESGIARLRRHQILNALLGTMAEARAQAHRDALTSATLWLGGDADAIERGTVIAPKKFGTRSLPDLMLFHRELRDGAAPPEWQKKILWEMWQQAFGDKPEEWMAQSQQELDAWQPPEQPGDVLRDMSGALEGE